MSLDREHSFWGPLSPLGGLTGSGLLVMASARLSWAVTVSGSLLCVYGLTSFSYYILAYLIGDKYFPQNGKTAISVCLASFWGCVYMLIIWLISPFAAMEVFILLLLVPLYCAGEFRPNKVSQDISLNVAASISNAFVLICLIILISIIREPLAYCMLSFPGMYQGMITIMYFNKNSFFPIEIFASSAGALLLLGFITYLYQYTKSFINTGDRI